MGYGWLLLAAAATSAAQAAAPQPSCDGSAIVTPANSDEARPPGNAMPRPNQPVGSQMVFICRQGYEGWKRQTGCPNWACVRRGVVSFRCTEHGSWVAQGGVEQCKRASPRMALRRPWQQGYVLSAAATAAGVSEPSALLVTIKLMV